MYIYILVIVMLKKKKRLKLIYIYICNKSGNNLKIVRSCSIYEVIYRAINFLNGLWVSRERLISCGKGREILKGVPSQVWQWIQIWCFIPVACLYRDKERLAFGYLGRTNQAIMICEVELERRRQKTSSRESLFRSRNSMLLSISLNVLDGRLQVSINLRGDSSS